MAPERRGELWDDATPRHSVTTEDDADNAVEITKTDSATSTNIPRWPIWVGGILLALELLTVVIILTLVGIAAFSEGAAGLGYLGLGVAAFLRVAALPIAVISALMCWDYLSSASPDDEARGAAADVIKYHAIFCAVMLLLGFP